MKLTAALLLPIALIAQAPDFEVASIKPNKTNERMYFGLRGPTLTVRNISLKGLIQIAYGKRDFQITGGPRWITAETFDIDAKAESPAKATHDMMKSLLASRFNLQVHSETKEAEIYNLVIARSGLKMKPSADQTDPDRGGPKQLAPGRILGDGIPMYILTNLLSNALGYAVINKTGLNAKYDIDLQYTPDADTDALDLLLMSALEKQLGLKLESAKAPQEFLVIDQAAHPSAN